MILDSAIELTGFSVHRSDRTKELTGKSRGGGVCFYINNSWCDERDLHSIKSFCSPDLEFHMLLCRPFWLPREFTAIIITAVYRRLTAMFDQPCQRRHLPLNPETVTIENKPVTISGDPSKLPNDNTKTKLKNNSTTTTQEACGRASTTSQVLKGINQLL